MAFLAVALVSCGTDPAGPVVRIIPKVRVPAAPEPPDLSKVEETTRGLKKEVREAREEVRRASETVREGRADAARVRAMTEEALESADEVAKVALVEIREAAEMTVGRLEKSAALLEEVEVKLEKANLKSEELGAEISDLKRDAALQTAAVEGFRQVALVANDRLERANDQRDEFAGAVAEATAKVAVLKEEVTRVKKQRTGMVIACLVLTVLCGGMGYVLLKI